MAWRCLWPAEALLGEGPLWCPDQDRLLFVDIKGPAILSWWPDGTGRHDRIAVPDEIGCLVARRAGGFLAAFRKALALVALDPLAIRDLCPIEPELPGNRCNDGKCDPQGRLWLATMDDAIRTASGAIWRLTGDGTLCRIADGHVVGNGFGWSPDGTVMYFTDSEERVIYAYPFDGPSGSLGPRRRFAEVPADAGFPDGLTVDREGGVWSAHWDGARVTRYRPDGRIDRVIGLPVPRPTSLAFGGADLDRLFVTSAAIGLSAEQRSRYPLSGGLFELDAGVRGLPACPFAG